MQTMNRGGDVLARGGVRMDIAPGSNATQEKWDKAFGEPEPMKKAQYVFECPTHGKFTNGQECFLSGGYPLLDEYKTSKCVRFDEGCEEVAKYAECLPL